jgi:hypothetical protein
MMIVIHEFMLLRVRKLNHHVNSILSAIDVFRPLYYRLKYCNFIKVVILLLSGSCLYRKQCPVLVGGEKHLSTHLGWLRRFTVVQAEGTAGCTHRLYLLAK